MAATKLSIIDQVKGKGAGGSAAAGDLFVGTDTAGTIARLAAAVGFLSWNGSAFAYATPTSVVLTEAPGTDATATGIYVNATAGENLVFGDVCYFKSDGKWWKADANGTGTYPAASMALGTITANNTGNFLLYGIARLDSWNWTVGGVIYLSTTAGEMTQTQPAATDDVIQVLAIGIHADRVLFRPSLDYITHT